MTQEETSQKEVKTMSIGRNIMILSFDKRITQKELAEAAGVTQSMISKIINTDIVPSVLKLKRIADKLGVTIDDLLK